jgi:streptomycin 6-kinase
MSALERLNAKAKQWDVDVYRSLETKTSVLGFGRRGSTQVALKVIKQPGDEWDSGRILSAFDGHGAVRIYESEPGAILVEQLEPGTHLVAMVRDGDDDAATKILADLIAQLANHLPPPNTPSVFDWAKGFDRYLSSDRKELSRDLVQEARTQYLELAHSQNTNMLLHGDLQHYNVLFDNTRGWLAIDPKGVVGELEYEIGAALRNPVEYPDIFKSKKTIERRVATFCERLEIDDDRVLRWAFAQAVLSEIWRCEDGEAVTATDACLSLAARIHSLFQGR